MEGKYQRGYFPTSNRGTAKKSLALVHSDEFGNINLKSLRGAECFLTFVDDFSHYTWVYALKKEDEYSINF